MSQGEAFRALVRGVGRTVRWAEEVSPRARPHLRKIRRQWYRRSHASQAMSVPAAEEVVGLVQQADIAYRAGRVVQAQHLYRRAISKDGSDDGAWLGLSRVHLRDGNLMGAASAAHVALALEPRSKRSRWLFAEIEAVRARSEPCLEILRNLRAEEAFNRSALVRIGRALRDKGAHEACVEALGWVIEHEAREPREAVLRDWYLAMTVLGRSEDALAHLRELNLDQHVLLRLRAAAAEASGDVVEAWGYLHLLPSGARPLPLLRRVMRSLYKAKDAHCGPCADALLELEPEHEDALFIRVLAAWRAGDEEAASSEAGRLALGATPNHRRAAIKYQLAVGRSDRAWQISQGMDPTLLSHPLLIRLAQGLLREGHVEAAAEAAALAHERDPDEPTARRLHERASSEHEVLKSGYRRLPSRVGSLTPIPGTVLHMVGKSLPHVSAGYTIRTQYVARCQQAVGLRPEVVTQPSFPWNVGVGSASTFEVVDGVPYHRLPVGPDQLLQLDRRLEYHIEQAAQVVRRVRPAALHAASDYLNATAALSLGEAFDLPVVYEVRGFWHETWVSKQGEAADERERYRHLREREMECAARADAVVTLAEVMSTELVGAGIPVERISVIPNAVDPDVFLPTERDEELARSYGIGREDVVVGYISSFVLYEGIHFLIEAVAELIDDIPNLRVLLVGDGNERIRLESQAKEMGLGERVVFAGRVPHQEIRRYYDLIDIFVVPRTNDRVCQLVTPLKPFEAMASEKALVVSDVPALRSMISEGRTGVTFRAEDPRALARELAGLVNDPAKRASLGSAARQFVSTERTWAANGARYAELYKELGVL